jgi:hypothetical protein
MLSNRNQAVDFIMSNNKKAKRIDGQYIYAGYKNSRTNKMRYIAYVDDYLTTDIYESIIGEVRKLGGEFPVKIYAWSNAGPNGSKMYRFEQLPLYLATTY